MINAIISLKNLFMAATNNTECSADYIDYVYRKVGF